MARTVPVRILRHQAQPFRLLFDGQPKTITLTWGRGLGKSFFIRLAIWMLIAKWYGKKRRTLDGEITGIRVFMLMPTLKQFKQVHGALLEAENNGKWKFLGGVLNKTDWSLTFPDGSKFIPVPAALATSERGRGFRGDVTVFDECDDIDKSVRAAITKPWFSEPWSLALELLAGTPKRGRNGMLYEGYRQGISTDPEFANCYAFKSRSADCPEIFSPRLLREAKRDNLPAVFAREYEVDFDSAEGLVYAFDERFHVREPDANVRFHRFAIGGDHGWTDPGVLLLGGIFGHGDHQSAWILEEHYASERPNHEWDSIVHEHYQGVTGWLDPSRPDRIADYRNAGLDARAADNSIPAGVARVADLLAKREIEEDDAEPYSRLYIHPRCVNTIREFSQYKRKRDPYNANAFLEQIEDRNNHAMDALRYLTIGEFGRSPSYRSLSPDA